ncbi:uncharacterized NOP5 family protein K07C5.4 [Tetranychus urticae]|uniref:Nucleolar protein 56 n=1 Tax=Tetranychus urticae TaxID=32264 RepID=T1KNR6_TETUR|nr:uncharacterized NOP5 family protein K07C5.4 [Tetranychus urticae]
MASSQLHVLFEHAVGYSLFRVDEYEEIAQSIPKVEKASLNFSNFKKLVKLIAFTPFKTGATSLENMLTLSEGNLSEDLITFLEKHGKAKMALGVADPKIGTAIQEKFPRIVCQHTGVVPELLRGIRFHADKLLDLTAKTTIDPAEAGLARSFSRSKVKFNVNRADNMIIQSISLLDQLDKDINTFAMRLREWYSYHFPELLKIVNDNYLYACVVQLIGDRKQIDETTIYPELKNIVDNEDSCSQIISAAKTSMGMDIAEIDLINISSFSSKVINLVQYRRQLMGYLQGRMANVAPNLSALIGETVGARLISHAGSLINLAKYPASTVQILGAEKALFRALKTRGNTPKHGLLFHSSFISKAGPKNKGRISRFLANKCSIASRIDCFNEQPADVFGVTLKDQVEERLAFYENGNVPKKNIDVMVEASEKARILADKRAKKLAKKAKKEATIKNEFDETISNLEASDETGEPKKKKKKSDIVDVKQENADEMNVDTPVSGKKKKKKNRQSNASEADQENSQIGDGMNVDDEANDSIADNQNEKSGKKKKKKKQKNAAEIDQNNGLDEMITDENNGSMVDEGVEDSESARKKAKKLAKKAKKLAAIKSEFDETISAPEVGDETDEPKKKKKKRV